MYSYKLNIPKAEHDAFVTNSTQTTVFQSSDWALVKDDWKSGRIGIYEDDQLKAVAAFLIRPIALGKTMMYIPRGPILDYQDEKLLAYTLTRIKAIAKTHKALFVKFDPYIHRQVHNGDQHKTNNPHANSIITRLQNLGCTWLGFTESMADTIQPRFQAVNYSQDFSEDILSKKTRQAIRTARNKGVAISFGGVETLDVFTDLMKKTEDRKSIHLRGKDYYKKLLTIYPDQSFITIASLDVKKRLTQLESDISKSQAQLSKYSANTKPSKIKATEDDIARLEEEKAFLAPYKAMGVIPLAGTLSIGFGETSENVYAGMDAEFRRYQAPLLLWFETAQHAFDLGNEWQNMGGIENNLDGGLYDFKSKFEPHIEEFIGEFNLPTSPLYRLTNFAYTLRKKWRSSH